jgi:CarD family transcriptional regulator
MNFEFPKSNFDAADQTPLRTQSSQCPESQAQQASKTRFGFRTRDFVVHPAHGAGQILSIEEQTVADASLEFFVIFFAKSKMTLRVPTQKVTSVGIRKLSDAAAINRARSTLSQRPNKARGNWSRLAQDYESKINSGDIIAVAEVMRDLYRPNVNSGQSFSERQLYAAALNRLSGEVALVDGITEQEVVREFEDLLSAGAKRSA